MHIQIFNHKMVLQKRWVRILIILVLVKNDTIDF